MVAHHLCYLRGFTAGTLVLALAASHVSDTEAAPVSSRLQLTLTGAAAGDLLGNSSVGTAGDVNGDGFADLIVSAHTNDAGGGDAGRAYVYYGGPGADATADLTLTGAAANDQFGASAGAGDVNGDGFADLIVGAYLNDAGGGDAGRAYVFYGGPSADAIADLILTGAAAGDNFGQSVGTAGDVNGDGFADVIVGAPLNDAVGANAGRAYVFYGGRSPDATVDLTLTGAAAGDQFGRAVGTAGDVNGDGFADLIVGAPTNDAGGGNAGRAYVYHGGPGADATADLTLTGAAASDDFGLSVGTGGDVNGDGFADLIVGAHQNDVTGNDVGRAYVYYGGPGADAIADLTLTGAAANDHFGVSVATAGDVNGDGFADVIVGAYWNDAGGNDAGRAYVYYGGPGADATADLTLTGAAAGDNFGSAVGTAGDVNGDGFADLIVGAPLNDAGGNAAGRAYLYDPNRYHLLSPNGSETWNVGALQSIRWLGAEPADLWLSPDGGATFQQLRTSAGGNELNAVQLRVPHLPTRFAMIRVTPSDPGVRGQDTSDSLFTIQASITLLSFAAMLTEGGAELWWSTEPGVGPEGLAGYRLQRLPGGTTGAGIQVGPGLITATRFVDPEGRAGDTYRLTALNGLSEELELGRLTVAGTIVGLRVWPSPLSQGRPLHVAFVAPMGSAGLPVSDLDVGVFDVRGRRVATLAKGQVAPRGGQVSLEWDTLSGSETIAPGLYLVRAHAPSAGFRAERKVVVLP